MKSKESHVAAQVRLNQWALEVQECMNRPKDMTVVDCQVKFRFFPKLVEIR